MRILFIALITAAAVFLFFLWYNRFSGKPLIVRGWQIHHSVTALVLFLFGLFLNSELVLAVGLGMYVSHVAEEMYFEGEPFGRALLIFITRA